jgi:hypothetical protein
MKFPYYFTIGNYRLMVDFTEDKFGTPTKDKWCWLWTGHYWQLFFPIEQAEISEADLKQLAATRIGADYPSHHHKQQKAL